MADRRVIKTRRNIRKAFLSLLAEKEFARITIKELAEQAEINRKTFYLHYSSLEDVMEEFRQDILQQAGETIERLDILSPGFREEEAYAVFTSAFSWNRKLLHSLLNEKRYGELIPSIQNKVHRMFVEFYSSKYGLNEDLLRVCAEYLTVGMMAVYKGWLDEEQALPSEELIKLTGRLIIPGIVSVLREAAGMK